MLYQYYLYYATIYLHNNWNELVYAYTTKFNNNKNDEFSNILQGFQFAIHVEFW